MQTILNNIILLVTFIFITTLTNLSLLNAQNNKYIVVLDAGHGGGDHGNLGNGYKEKDIALKITLEVGKALEKNPNIKVIYTRKKDVFVELYKRAEIANKADADLFVSIHCNSVANPKPYGTETWVLGERNTDRNFEVAKRENEVIFLEDNHEENYAGFDPSSPESTIAIGIEQEVYVEQSIILARKIEDNFKIKAKRKSRGLKQESLLVIRNTYMPSVLVEVGFLTNSKEGAYLNSKKGQLNMASAIKDAILDYKRELDQNVGSNVINTDKPLDNDTNTKPRVIDGVTFKIQISASKKNIATKPYNFKGLEAITKEKAGAIYKYFFGKTSDYHQAQKLQQKAKTSGFKDAFIVAYKDGDKISVSQALKSSTD